MLVLCDAVLLGSAVKQVCYVVLLGSVVKLVLVGSCVLCFL